MEIIYRLLATALVLFMIGLLILGFATLIGRGFNETCCMLSGVLIGILVFRATKNAEL